ERDYVKLVYQYSLDDLFDNREIIKRAEAISRGETQDPTPNLNSAFTSQGKQVLLMVRDMIHTLARGHIEDLIQANKEV
ncbi:MAG: hypothetical protein GWM98_02960, partial [Nitrospinaceae bacterium]|nr:hypothetical protein [Nitrospinaceae bacterium]NIR53657.1 hypothetical protein [Nitrospinaceae bacterium]NIS84063.1 hypothetical protein [Nitrospinaceae bacterium]NIT80864.1 hypothetical protein [Nitrospinaceae bacterium]NIU43173.1 hypothetical protein [Nitrospinaceae bacterium]